jgi:pantoate--beta-alanine ligase
MGNLHEGHLELIKQCWQKFPVCVMSIFVNPTQFGPSEDFDRYPRTLADDVKKLQALAASHPQKTLLLWTPTSEEIYGKNFSTFITPGALGDELEGKHRPGHFQGVLTVVYLLFQLIKPDAAYFGKKDYQQYVLIKKMVEELKLPLSIIPVEIMRTSLGLALSSRNQYLTAEEKTQALELPKNLQKIAQTLSTQTGSKVLNLDLLTTLEGAQSWDYLEVRNRDLSPINEKSRDVVLLGVMRINKLRLLDNIEFQLKVNESL